MLLATRRLFAVFKAALFVGATLPLALLLWDARGHALGKNPVSEALARLGLTALILLLASLACTPLNLLFRWTFPVRLRRMLGLFAFFYACLHLATYAALDQGLDFPEMAQDIAQHPFILAGIATFLLLVPLAVTSPGAMVRRMGYARWKWLHRSVYLAAVLAVVHFWFKAREHPFEPTMYALALVFLLGVRALFTFKRSSARATAP